MPATTSRSSAGAIGTGVRWGRVVGIAFALEVVLFAVLVPIQSLLALNVWIAAVATGCLVFGYAAGRWLARGVTSRLALHGFLVGAVATLIYLAICAVAPGGIPAAAAVYGLPLYILNNVLRIAGCVLGAVQQERSSSV